MFQVELENVFVKWSLVLPSTSISNSWEISRSVLRIKIRFSDNDVIRFQCWIKELPKPVLPPLEVTLERYLASIEAVVSKNQYDETVRIVEEFAKGEGVTLHRLVEKLAQEKENWVSSLSGQCMHRIFPRYIMSHMSRNSSRLGEPRINLFDLILLGEPSKKAEGVVRNHVVWEYRKFRFCSRRPSFGSLRCTC